MKNKLKKLLIIIFILFMNINFSFAQQGWINLNASFSGGGIYFKDANSGIVGSYKTINGGLSWNYIGNNQFINISISFPNQNTGYVVGGSYINKTTNFGDNWELQNNPSNLLLYSINFPNVYTGFACGDAGSIIKTTNGGNSWFLLNTPYGYFNLRGIYFTDSMNGNVVGDRGFRDTNIFMKTTNGGSNWAYQLLPAFSYGGGIGDLTSLFFMDVVRGLIGGTGRIKLTATGGSEWVTVFTPTMNQINSLYFPSASTGYGACYGGQIIKTTNGGNNWFLQTTGTGSNLSSIFFINNLTGYAAGDNNTVLKTTDGGGPPIGIKTISGNIPKNYKLYQNHPNPFNPTTNFRFQVASYRLIKLVIYDALGKIVAEPVNTELQPGAYEVEWSAPLSFSSGVYFYRLHAGDYMETKRMVLLK
jgi:photosystem II stability/assembly factor-like uncharacterized protein